MNMAAQSLEREMPHGSLESTGQASDDLRRLWDGESRKYVGRGDSLADFPLPAEFLPRAGERVLDAGCGAGNYLSMYRRITGEVFGVDFSSAMVSAATNCGRVVQGDIQQLPFGSAQFDYASSHVVISHVHDPRAALAELARITKPGGRLVVVVPNWLSFLAPARVLMIRLGKYSLGPCRHYSLFSLRREGAEHGLVVRRVHTVPKVPSAPSPLRSFFSWLGYGMDQAMRAAYPHWGGDLAVLFEKRAEPTVRSPLHTPPRKGSA